MPKGPTVAVDCRWLGIGGPGRTTELLLRGLAVDPPDGRWLLWGRPDRAGPLAWPGAEVAPVADDPRSMLGQRHTFRVPTADLAVFMHQQRPLRRLPALTVIHDTIPLRHGGTPAIRRAKRAYLRRVAAVSERILTVSEYSRRSIVDHLGVSPDVVDVLRFPFDPEFVDRVAGHRRHAEAPADVALYVGNFLPHKNLSRLVKAFEATAFQAGGGRLVLAGGGAKDWVDDLVAGLTDGQRRFVSVVPDCSQAELERLFATSLFLVQPSLEEGFGLPAWEAMCCGLPVCSSDGGALPELVAAAPADMVTSFRATSVPGMTAALDECAVRARGRGPDDALRASELVRAGAPTVAAFGAQLRAIVEAQVHDRQGRSSRSA